MSAIESIENPSLAALLAETTVTLQGEATRLRATASASKGDLHVTCAEASDSSVCGAAPEKKISFDDLVDSFKDGELTDKKLRDLSKYLVQVDGAKGEQGVLDALHALETKLATKGIKFTPKENGDLTKLGKKIADAADKDFGYAYRVEISGTKPEGVLDVVMLREKK